MEVLELRVAWPGSYPNTSTLSKGSMGYLGWRYLVRNGSMGWRYLDKNAIPFLIQIPPP